MENTHSKSIDRTAYILACDVQSARTVHCINVLDRVGFSDIIPCPIIPHTSVPISNRMGMQSIYDRILKSGDEWAYVFEDDIETLTDIKIDEIVQYEEISKNHFFYLGCCGTGPNNTKPTNIKINNNTVYQVNWSNIRGLHAIGVSRQGIETINKYIDKYSTSIPYLDALLGRITEDIPTNLVRADLVSPYWKDHKGAFFQDRKKFPSQWETTNWNL